MIYADYNGSAPLLPSVREYLKRRLDSDLYANPNAIHSMGQKVSQGLEKCREIIAQIMGAYSDQIIFTSGASEGISNVLHSILTFAPQDKRVIITSPIEHPVIPNALEFFKSHLGFKVLEVEIDENGKVQLESFKDLIKNYKNHLALVTIMAANNETGVLQPYEEIAKICRELDIPYLCDTTQLIGKGEFHFEKSGVDYAICSGHKVGAMTGTGFVLAREPGKLHPLIFGSTQERGHRGGTQHYLGIETLAVALKDFDENKQKLVQLKEARLRFEKDVTTAFPQSKIIGVGADRLAGTTLIGYPGIHGQAVQIELESHDIFVTTSAACTDNQPETSKVLKAMNVHDDLGRGVIRISLSTSHGEKDYALLAQTLKSTYNKLNKIKSF